MSEHDGHRQRIIQKLSQTKLRDHEYLEILLFNAFARRNTNDLAHRLLAAFGSVDGVFNAKMEDLQQVDGIGPSAAAYLFCIGELMRRRHIPEDGYLFPNAADEKAFLDYIYKKYSALECEELDFYFLNEEQDVILCKSFSIDSPEKVVLEADGLTKLLVEVKPCGLIMVHNHLKGSCLPSEADNRTTNQCQVICSIHNVLFCDHLIYSPMGVFSYYKSGKMKEISNDYSIGPLLEKSHAKKK